MKHLSSLPLRRFVVVMTCAVSALAALECVASIVLPKSVWWDPSYGLLAAQHYCAGRSPSILQMVVADPSDLTRDRVNEVTLWAPAYQAVPWLLRLAGLVNWGVAINLTVAGAMLLGVVGWWIYFKRLCTGPIAALCLIGCVVCSKFAFTNAIGYVGGDLILWTVAPWVVLANAWAMSIQMGKVPACAVTLATGLVTPFVFLVKYSGVGLCLGAFVAWCALAIGQPKRRGEFVVWILGATCAGLVILYLGFPKPGNAAPNLDSQLAPSRALLSLGLWTLGVTDLESLVSKCYSVLGIEQRCLVQITGLGVIALIAISIGPVVCARALVGSLRAFRSDRSPLRGVGATVAAVDICVFATLVLLGGRIDLHGRFGRVAGLLLLPYLLEIWMDSIRSRSKSVGAVASVVCVLVICLLPAAYGVTAGTGKLLMRCRQAGHQVGSDYVVNHCLAATTRQQAFYSEVRSHLISDATILYSVYPQMVFPLPRQRCIIIEAADLYSASMLRRLKYCGSPEDGVALLIPSGIGGDKVVAIRRSFVDIHGWRYFPLKSDPAWEMWISEGSADTGSQDTTQSNDGG